MSTKTNFVRVDLLDIVVVIHECERPLIRADNILLYQKPMDGNFVSFTKPIDSLAKYKLVLF